MSPRIRVGDHQFLALLALVVLINVPFLSPRLIFVHDTLSSFTFFHFAYSNLYVHNEFPRWIPLMGYGIPFDFNLFSCLLPTDYVAMALGWVLGIQDVLLLFKISIILSQCIFVQGLYLLTSRLFTKPLAVWMVCLGGMLTNSWIFNSAWNFSPIYLMPLELYFLIDFIERQKPASLWIAAILEIGSLLGTVSYIAPLHLLVAGTFLVTQVCQRPELLWLFLRPRNFLHPLLAVFLVCAGLLGALVFGMEVVFLAGLRDPQTGNVPLDVFLTLYHYPLAGVLTAMVRGDVPIGDLIVYVGLLPFLTAVYALLRRRDAYFWSFAAVALVLFWFSQGGYFATLTYYVVPMMNKFRHISFTFGTFKLFLLLLGGFGFDQFLRDLAGDKPDVPAPIMGLPSLTLPVGVVIVCLVDLLVHLRQGDLTDLSLESCDQSFAQEWYATWVFAARLLVYAALAIIVIVALRRRPGWGRGLAAWSMTIYLADVGFFYLLTVTHAPFVPASTPVGRAFYVHALTYRPQRTLDEKAFLLDRPHSIARIILAPRNGYFQSFTSLYSSIYLFTDVDVLAPRFRLDQIMAGVKDMIEARGGKVPGDGPAMLMPTDDPDFVRSLGLGLPKSRIVRDVVVADNNDGALRLFTPTDPAFRVRDPATTIVIVGEPRSGSGEPAPENQVDVVEVSHFSANRMRLKVSAATAGWLFCADAFHPAWKATVDGAPTKVFRANIGCKAVPVPAGTSEVEFYFDGGARDWVRNGVALMGALLGLVLTTRLLKVLLTFRVRT